MKVIIIPNSSGSYVPVLHIAADNGEKVNIHLNASTEFIHSMMEKIGAKWDDLNNQYTIVDAE